MIDLKQKKGAHFLKSDVNADLKEMWGSLQGQQPIVHELTPAFSAKQEFK